MSRPRQKRVRSEDADPGQEIENWEELNETTKRRLRNRLSQRHFRERKSMYIKELEERTKSTVQSESERNKILIQEAVELRKATLKLRSQVLKISVALKCIGAEVGRILNLQGVEGSDFDEDIDDGSGSDGGGRGMNTRSTRSKGNPPSPKGQARTSSRNSVECQPVVEEQPVSPPDSHSNSQSQTYIATNSVPGQLEIPVDDIYLEQTEAIPEEYYEEQPIYHAEPCNNIPLENFIGELFANSEMGTTIDADTENTSPPSSGQDPFPYDKAPQHNVLEVTHQDISGLSATHRGAYMPFTMVPAQTGLMIPPGLFPNPPGVSYQLPNVGQSMFSEHIEALETQCRYKLDMSPDELSRQIAYQSCTAIMSLFICNAWPRTHSLWFKSQVPEIIGPILLWRIHPTTESYKNLLPDYKPTQIQLTVPHSAVIDWVPYAPLRDRVILHYNHSVVLDRLLCDMMNSYVIEVNDLSQIIPNAPPGRAYFGVWNVYSAIDAASAALMKNQSELSQADSSFVESRPDFIHQQFNGNEQNFSSTPNAFQDLLFSSMSLGVGNNDRQNSLCHNRSNSFNLLEILTTPALVLKLSHDIRLHAAKTWRFDPSLFVKWPELKFEGYEAFVATGKSYRIPTAPPDAPIQMTEATKTVYQEAIQSLA